MGTSRFGNERRPTTRSNYLVNHIRGFVGMSVSDWAKTRAKSFTDIFTRADNANTLEDVNTRWLNVTGTWGITSNKATSSTIANNPVALFDTNSVSGTTKVLGGNVGAGYGVAFWGTDVNNWWGAVTERTTYTDSPYLCQNGGTTNSNGTCFYDYGGAAGQYSVCSCGGTSQFGGTCFTCCWGPPTCPAYYYPNGAYTCYAGGYAVNTSNCRITYGSILTTYYKHDVIVKKKLEGVTSTVSTTTVANVTSSTDYIAYVQANTTDVASTVTARMTSGGAIASVEVPASSPIPGPKTGLTAGAATTGGTNQIDSMEYTASP